VARDIPRGCRDGVCDRYTLIGPDSAIAEIARILGILLGKPKWVFTRYNVVLTQASLVPVARRVEKAELA
jgi:hypothetical protein